MTHKHRSRTEAKNRSDLVHELSNLLWDDTKPEGEEGVPEDQWEAILYGPCNGDKQLIEEVCQYERFLRYGQDEPIILKLMVDESSYQRLLERLFNAQEPVRLLWDEASKDWYPEERWVELLSADSNHSPENLDFHLATARRMKKVRADGYIITGHRPLS